MLSFKKLNTKVLFKLLKLGAERRLTQSQLLGGAGDALALSNCHEIIEMVVVNPNVHILPTPIAERFFQTHFIELGPQGRSRIIRLIVSAGTRN